MGDTVANLTSKSLTRKVTLPIPLMTGFTPMLLYSSMPAFVGRCAIFARYVR
eukprot:COSAG02_NODE_5445_length_4316_cov_1.519089_3_plen_52_part_00